MRKINTFFKSIFRKKTLMLFAAMAMAGSASLRAQTNIANYRFTQGSGTYTPITGGTVLVAASTNYDDLNSSAITIPAFSFGGASVTTVYVNSNGYITMGASHSTSEYSPLSSSGTNVTGVVSGLGCDNGYSSGGGTTGAVSEIRYQQLGDEFVAQFQDVKRWASTNERITFQIRLNSTTGEIKIIYGGTNVIGSSTTAPQVGIRGSNTTWASNVNNLRLLDVPAGTTCSWADAITGNSNSATMTLTTTNTVQAPSNGLTYTWTPPAAAVPPVRTFGNVTSVTNSGATMTWTAPTGATQYNIQYRIPGTCTWTNYAGNPVSGNTVTLSGLQPATTYQVRVQNRSGANTSIWSHIPSNTGGDGYTTTGTFTTLCTTPAPGATIASVTSNLCAGNTVAFSLTTATPGPGVTYQWQSSTDNVTYTNVSGATSATYTGPAQARYYRCMVKCAAGPDSTASGPVQLTYNNNVTSVTNGQRCGIGTVNLSAAGSAGSTIKWYSAVAGGSSLATGTTFTTPSINSTTQYYASAEAIASTVIPVGAGASTGTSVAYNPTQGGYGGLKGQYLFTATELLNAGLAAGNITALSLEITSTGSTLNGFTIQIGTTSLTDFPTPVSILATPNTVYPSANFTPVVGVNTFTFATPYNWDGVSNIVVSTSWSNNNSSNNASTVRYDATTNNTSQTYRKDNETAANMLSFTGTSANATGTNTFDRSTNRPKMIFAGQGTCSSPRMPVTATVNTPPAFAITPNQTICNGAVTPLSVTSPGANYNNVVWSPITNLYTNSSATTPYTAGSNVSTVYLKSSTAGSVVYTATANSTATSCGAATTDTITVLPPAATAVATPSAICFSGSATLVLVPATGYGAATFQWQSSMNNTAFVDTNGTAATYTTPTLTSTRYYRAVIKNSSGVTCFNSGSDTALVNTPAVTGTTPAARCGPGTVNLSATVNTGATANWFTSATSNVPVATGSAYAPNVTATTNYWVAARMSGTGSGTGTTTIGNGTTTTTSTEELTAFCNRRLNYKMQIIFTSAELAAAGIPAGNLTSIGFNITDIGDAASNNNFTVKIGTTAQTSATTTFISTGLNTVYGPSTYTHAVGLNTITFATPFSWDGASNIVVEVTHDGIDDIDNATTTYSTTTNSMTCFGYNTPSSATTSTKRFNTTFGHTLPCESPRQQVTATVNPLPTITVTPNGTQQVCAGSSTTLTATGGGTYQWKNASGNMGGQTNPAFTTGTAGTYKVVVTTPATGCFDSSAAITVNVNPLPVVNLGNDTAFCSGNTLTLNAGNAGSTYLWNDNSTNATKAVTATGTYFVKVTNSNNCVKSDTINVVVNPTPVVALGNDTNLCLGVNYVLNAGNPGATYLWDNATTAQTRTVTNTGTYYVRVRNSFNCIARDTVTTTFFPTPIVNLGADRDICAGASVTLDAGNPGETYLWDNNSTAQTRTVTATGTYYVAVNNIANCKGRDTVTVTVHPLPVVNLGNDTVFCHGNTLTLNAGNPGATYRWNDNSTNQTLNASSTGNYSVVVTDVHACIGSDNINILVKDPPSGNINAVYSNDATYVFNVLNARYVSGYTWDFGDGSPRVTGATVQHQYARNGIYNVTVMLAGECSDSLGRSRTVDVFDAAGGTGIPQVKDSKDLLLYPNPARDIVTLENKHNLKMKQIAVYNIVGQLISDSKADSGDKHILHTQAYAPGMYTIRIETDKGIVIRKFEIMK